MNKIGIAVVLVSALSISTVAAQEVISNPGKCAQFYPNANCTNYGPGNPYRGPQSYQSGFRNGYAWDHRSSGRHHHRHYQ
jgi:hypothetical protein